MEMLDCIMTRHSTRKFKEEQVADVLIERVVEAGRLAPSGKHKEQSHFVVVKNKSVLDKLITLVQQEFAKMEVTAENADDIGGAIKLSKKGTYVFKYNAPTLIIVANKKNYGNNIADVSCAMENMMLAANALDLGSCWINQLRWLNENPVLLKYLQALGLEEDERVYASLSLGYPDTPDGLPIRKGAPVKGNRVDYVN